MTVGIIGLGLIGGSLAKAFQRDESVTVLGWDADHSIVEFAEIAQAICDKLGYELKIEDMSFETILASVNSGKADFGAAGMTVTPEREESVDFTDTYANATQVVIVRK